jgi:hypothetical protein
MADSTPDVQDAQAGSVNDSQQNDQTQSADNQVDNTASSTDTTQGTTDDAPQVTQNSDDNSNDDGQNDDSTDEIAEWAKKQGIDLDNPTPEQARTLAKRVLDNQRAYHEAKNQNPHQAADSVSDAINDASTDDTTGPSESDKELAALRTERFFSRNQDAEQYADKMAELIQKEGEDYGPEAAWRLANNLPRLLTLAKADVGANDTSQYTQGRQDERRNLAASQQAGAPASNAVSSAPQSTAVTDKTIGEMSTAEYMEWRKTHNPWEVPA